MRFGNRSTLAMLAVIAGMVTALPINAQTKAAKKPAQQTSQAGPSLKETLDFVSQALASDSGSGRSTKDTIGGSADYSYHTNLTANGSSCKVTFSLTINIHTTNANGFGSITASHSFALNLADIDPSSVNVTAVENSATPEVSQSGSGYTVNIGMHNLDKKIVDTWSSAGTWNRNNGQTTSQNVDPKEEELSKLGIGVSDNEIASRIAHALTHAVELCGGQKSAF